MEFSFSEKQNLLREAMHEFVINEIEPHASEWDEKDECPVDVLKKMGDVGILGMFVPKEYGGVGLGHVERLIALEEISRYSAGLGICMFAHQLSIGALLFYGTEEQKSKYLPKLCSGEMIAALATTEPSGGSDLFGQKSTAELEDGMWKINGRKCLITNSHIADIAVVTAKTGTDAKGRNQFTAFIIEKEREGFEPGWHENKLGLRSSVTGDLILNNVKVPEENILGALGQGVSIAQKTIGEVGRAGMSTVGLGILRGCLEESVKFANERIEYGKPISKMQPIQFYIAENRLDYEVGQLLVYRAASNKDKGEVTIPEFSMAKLYNTERACEAAKRTIELMGGHGVINEYPVGRYLRDALTCLSAGGTSEIQKIIINGDTMKKYNN